MRESRRRQRDPDRQLFERQKLNSESFTLGTGKATDAISESEFVDCTIRVADAFNCHMRYSRFTRCRFEMLKQAEGFSHNCCEFEECTFVGRYHGCHFGTVVAHPPGLPLSPPPPPTAEHLLRSCDFSEATLHDCLFMRISLETTRFPSWPNFVVLYPLKHVDDWNSIPFPDSFQTTKQLVVGYDDTVKAFAINWDRFCEEAKEDLNRRKARPSYEIVRQALKLPDEVDPTPEMGESLRKIFESKSYIRI
jgi:hypothetical protein